MRSSLLIKLFFPSIIFTYTTSLQYDYMPWESEKQAKVDVVWNTNYYIDDENDVQGKLKYM